MMKAFNTIKKMVLVLVILLGVVLSFVGRVPELPSSKPYFDVVLGENIRNYLIKNMFSIAFFITAIVVGLFMLIYGLSVSRKIKNLKNDGAAAVNLGEFVLVSGLWVITDSQALIAFTTDCGGVLNRNAIGLISYISVMLLPIIYISFLQKTMQIKKLWIVDGLFVLNLSLFVIHTIFLLDKGFYFVFLIIHHALIYIFILIGVVYFIKNFRRIKDKQGKLLMHSTILFYVFSGAALISFLAGSSYLYVILYSVGFVIMILYMIRITVNKILLTFGQSLKAELYESMAYTDMMTNIKNRNAFIKENYDSAVNQNTCCIVLDINKLKWSNDTFGHSYGDELICRSAKIIGDAFDEIGPFAIESAEMNLQSFAIIQRNPV